jgi:hypothetical protein
VIQLKFRSQITTPTPCGPHQAKLKQAFANQTDAPIEGVCSRPKDAAEEGQKKLKTS